MKEITSKMLNGACKDQLRVFKKTFGGTAAITMANARKARKAGLDIDWIVRFLSPSALAEYGKARDLAWAEHGKARGLTLAEYTKACDRGLVKALLDS